MLETETLRFDDGTEAKCRRFPCMRAYALLHELLKCIPLEALVKANLGSDVLLIVIGSAWALPADRRDEMTLKVLASTAIQTGGKSIDLTSIEKVDLAFGSDLGKLFKTLRFALETNYGGFTSAVSKLLGSGVEGAAEGEGTESDSED